MKTTLFSVINLLALLLFVSCSTKTEDQKFRQFGDEFLQQYFAFHPTRATSEGEHKYDHFLDDVSDSSRTHELQWLEETQENMEKFSYPDLNQQNKIDFQILLNQVRYMQFQLQELHPFEKNPLVYTGILGNGIYSLVARDFAPVEQRMQSMLSRLGQVYDFLNQAKNNLENPPRVHTETAIQQTQGVISLIENTLPQYINEATDSRDSLYFVSGKASQALRQFKEWLQKDLLPRSNGDFRLGSKLYDKKLTFALNSNMTRQQILDRADNEYKRVREEMFITAFPLYYKYFPRQKTPQEYSDKEKENVIRAVLQKLSEDHPTAETVIPLAKQYLQQLTEFVKKYDLVTIPDVPLEVVEMPEFQRGVAVAYCESSGPLEKKKKTFYAVAPPPEDWSQQQKQSFYREYNNYMLQDLTMHEAMPGHYVQIAHANQFDSPLRAIFGSGTFIEGWAVYSEKMMLGTGYDGPEVKLQQLKMYLRAIINAILDQKIHTDNMSEKKAMEFMTKGGFQEEGEAAGKWRRAILTSTQLSTYFVGVQEILDIRKEYETMKGKDFNLKEFHDTLLSYGSPPPRFVRHLLIESEE